MKIEDVNGYDPRAKTPYLQSYNFTVERQLSAGMVLEVAYAGSMNHANFNLPENAVNAPNVATIRVAHDPRQMQFGLQLTPGTKQVLPKQR